MNIYYFSVLIAENSIPKQYTIGAKNFREALDTVEQEMKEWIPADVLQLAKNKLKQNT